VPLLLVGPSLVESRERFERSFASGPHPAPLVSLGRSTLERYAPREPYSGAVPVLLYHGINDDNDRYSVSREAFALHMEMLDVAGYDAISIEQYLRFRAGDLRGLPPRPVLITFDDGRLDSFRGADAVLERHGMRAVMYSITGPVADGNPFYLSWRELHAMRSSGRWDVQPHGRDGHRRIVADPSGATGAFYASRSYTRSEGVETYADYARRVAGDVYELKGDFERHGIAAESFAPPYGDVGQHADDRRIPGFLRDLLETQFRVVFLQAEGNDPPYTRPAGPALRYEVHTGTRAHDLHAWLVRHNPARPR
jgi:peptidoglycan/xylan/chitin deacetylase (PgdA/CDA1 family)